MDIGLVLAFAVGGCLTPAGGLRFGAPGLWGLANAAAAEACGDLAAAIGDMVGDTGPVTAFAAEFAGGRATDGICGSTPLLASTATLVGATTLPTELAVAVAAAAAAPVLAALEACVPANGGTLGIGLD